MFKKTALIAALLVSTYTHADTNLKDIITGYQDGSWGKVRSISPNWINKACHIEQDYTYKMCLQDQVYKLGRAEIEASGPRSAVNQITISMVWNHDSYNGPAYYLDFENDENYIQSLLPRKYKVSELSSTCDARFNTLYKIETDNKPILMLVESSSGMIGGTVHISISDFTDNYDDHIDCERE